MDAAHSPECPNCFGTSTSTPCPHCGWQPGADNPPPALALGTLLDGRYRIGRVLGHGGFGITYLAWDDNLQLRLAIKEYLPRDCATRAPDGVSLAIYSGQAGEQFAYGLDRFLDEARALARFDQHPGIVTVKSFFRAHGTGYCVMDYVEGLTLKQYLERQPGGRLPVGQAWLLLQPVMDALRAVHKEGLLHRDLAPDNIYITRDGRVKLLDFGAARFAAGEHSRSLSIILKPGYAPEEQYRSRGKQGPWTDVYGLAATLYRAITGTVPPEALDRLDKDDLVAPSRLGIPITAGQEAVLLKALAVKADARYPTMQGLLDGGGEVESGSESAKHKPSSKAPQPPAAPKVPPASVTKAPVSEPSSPESPRRWGIGWLIAFVLIWALSIAGLSGFFEADDPTSPQSPMTRDVVSATPPTSPPLLSSRFEGDDSPSPSSARERKSCDDNAIAVLEERFIANLARFALMSDPVDEHAMANLRQVLSIIERDEQCRWNGKRYSRAEIEADARRRIAERYLILVDREIARGNSEAAQAWIQRVEEVDEKNSGLAARNERILEMTRDPEKGTVPAAVAPNLIYYAEQYARLADCEVSHQGAVLVESSGESEIYQVHCKDGNRKLIECIRGECRGVEVESLRSSSMNLGQCIYTSVDKVDTRLAGVPGSGSAITFRTGLWLGSNDSIPQAESSRSGDFVKVCLIFIPENCPPGDERGKRYRVTNLRTKEAFTLPDSSHGCGGA